MQITGFIIRIQETLMYPKSLASFLLLSFSLSLLTRSLCLCTQNDRIWPPYPSQSTVTVLAICRDWIVVFKFQIPRRAYDWPCLAQVSNHTWPSWLVYPVYTAPWMKGNYCRRGDGSWIWKIVLEFLLFTIGWSWCLEPQKSQIKCIPRAVK